MYALRAIIFFFFIGILDSCWGKTIVFLENRTGLRLHLQTIQSGHPLSQGHWAQLAGELAPRQRRAVLEFNRDKGIKKGKYFVFTTSVRGEHGGGDEVQLLQLLKGKTINSHLWQSLAKGKKQAPWNDNRDLKNMSVVIDGRHIRVNYQAVADGTDDNIIYRFEELPTEDIGEEETRLSILNYNIYMRPVGLFKNGQFLRADLLPEVLGGNDVISFSEAFDDDARKRLLSNLEVDYPYSTKVVGKDRGLKQDGGVVIVSKWPILEEDEYLFGDLCFKAMEDCLSNKGVGYAKVLKGTKIYHIFATHLQAGYSKTDKEVRRAQLMKLKRFIDEKDIPQSDPVIITGDFNVPRKELGPLTDAQAGSNYSVMLEILRAGELAHGGHRYSFDPSVNELAKDSEPPELVDHVMYSLDHQRPVMASQSVLLAKSTEPWREYLWEDLFRDLSDHFPVRAVFEF